MKPKRHDPRTNQFFALYEGGNTQPEIADIFGLTRERVRQIISKHPDYKRLTGISALSPMQLELLDQCHRKGMSIWAAQKLSNIAWRTIKDYYIQKSASTTDKK